MKKRGEKKRRWIRKKRKEHQPHSVCENLKLAVAVASGVRQKGKEKEREKKCCLRMKVPSTQPPV